MKDIFYIIVIIACVMYFSLMSSSVDGVESRQRMNESKIDSLTKISDVLMERLKDDSIKYADTLRIQEHEINRLIQRSKYVVFIPAKTYSIGALDSVVHTMYPDSLCARFNPRR